MNLYHLAYFTVLAQTQHYGKAAEILGITQPSLSHAMASLEEEIGVTLFEKSGRNIILGSYGEQFLLPVTQALDILNKGLQDLKDIQSGCPTLCIGCTAALGTSTIPDLIFQFQESHPDISFSFQLDIDTPINLLQNVSRGIYHLVFCPKNDEKPDPTLSFTPFTKEKMVLVVPQEHPLAKFDSIHLQRAVEYPFLAFSPNHPHRQVVDSMMKELEEEPVPAFQIGDEQVIASMVSRGFGISVVPYSPFLKALPIKALQISSPQWFEYTYTAIKKEGYRPPALQSLYDFCTRCGRVII